MQHARSIETLVRAAVLRADVSRRGRDAKSRRDLLALHPMRCAIEIGYPRMEVIGFGIAAGLIGLGVCLVAAADKINDAVRYYVDHSKK